MSSYLNICGILKEDKKKKPLLLTSYSRSDDLYNDFREEGVAYIGNLEENYTEINKDMTANILRDLNSEIKGAERRLVEYEKYAANNPEYITDIISTKEYLEDLKRRYHIVEFIDDLVGNTEYDYVPFEKYVANID